MRVHAPVSLVFLRARVAGSGDESARRDRAPERVDAAPVGGHSVRHVGGAWAGGRAVAGRLSVPLRAASCHGECAALALVSSQRVTASAYTRVRTSGRRAVRVREDKEARRKAAGDRERRASLCWTQWHGPAHLAVAGIAVAGAFVPVVDVVHENVFQNAQNTNEDHIIYFKIIIFY
jgi:hypothetical protein